MTINGTDVEGEIGLLERIERSTSNWLDDNKFELNLSMRYRLQLNSKTVAHRSLVGN